MRGEKILQAWQHNGRFLFENWLKGKDWKEINPRDDFEAPALLEKNGLRLYLDDVGAFVYVLNPIKGWVREAGLLPQQITPPEIIKQGRCYNLIQGVRT